jgi:hypothetical protein
MSLTRQGYGTFDFDLAANTAVVEAALLTMWGNCKRLGSRLVASHSTSAEPISWASSAEDILKHL